MLMTDITRLEDGAFAALRRSPDAFIVDFDDLKRDQIWFERPAVNASPLIFLAGAELLVLLRLAGYEIVVPSVIVGEIRQSLTAEQTIR